MQNFFTLIALSTLAVVAGCSQGTPGGPGTTDASGKKPVYGQNDRTFNLTIPATSPSVQQGEQTDVVIGIKRALNFDSDVTLKFSEIPKGVTIEPVDAVIKHGDMDVTITLKATDEAVKGGFKIKVTGHPEKGGDAHIDLKLKIAAKDSFTLSSPLLSTPLKQGEVKSVSIGITRDKTFDQDVKIAFGDMPTGVTLEPSDLVIKHGDSDAQITLTSADDAALGNFTITLTGHPAIGSDASNELKLTVLKK